MKTLLRTLFLSLVISSLGWGNRIELDLDPDRLLSDADYNDTFLEGLNRYLMSGGDFKLSSLQYNFYITISVRAEMVNIGVDFGVEKHKEVYHKTLMCLFCFILAKSYKVYLVHSEEHIYVEAGLLNIKTKNGEMLPFANEILKAVKNTVGILFTDCSFTKDTAETIRLGLSLTTTELYFCNCNLNGNAFEEFCKTVGIHTHVEVLGICNCTLGSGNRNRFTPILAFLLNCGSIKRLSLRDLDLSNKDIELLVAFLSSYRNIEVLDLSGNPIGNDGAKCLCDLLLLDLPIKELCLAKDIRDKKEGDSISREGAEALINTLKTVCESGGRTLRYLDLRGNPTGFKMQEVLEARKAGLYDTYVLLDSDILTLEENSMLLCSAGASE